MAGITRTHLFLGAGLSGLLFLLLSGAPRSLLAQLDTEGRISQPGFWPTQTKYPRSMYVGSQECNDCHSAIFKEAQQTSMAHAATPANESTILASHPAMTFSDGSYQYSIRTANGVSTYTALKGLKAQSAIVVWAFGTDRVGQSWLIKKKDGEFYEARMTYFTSLGTLDFTPGRALTENQSMGDADLDEAMERPVGRAEVYRCFGCHTTASGRGSIFDEEKLIPGVTCEACHGPGKAHIDEIEGAAVGGKSNADRIDDDPNGIFNPQKLAPEELADFCGACHGSYWDASLSGITGVGSVRFQPYRLEESKCWNKNDSRITCIACHDPHKQLDTDTADYDHACLSCHVLRRTAKATLTNVTADTSHPGAACPVAKKDCASCHMPQVYVPEMHQAFLDHRIRVARQGDPFPD